MRIPYRNHESRLGFWWSIHSVRDGRNALDLVSDTELNHLHDQGGGGLVQVIGLVEVAQVIVEAVR